MDGGNWSIWKQGGKYFIQLFDPGGSRGVECDSLKDAIAEICKQNNIMKWYSW